ncbi:UNVERIFIED_CONTAM: hypothetical protein RMT77_018680 [Armadillidium vulgare]
MLLNRITFAIGVFLTFQFSFSNGDKADERHAVVKAMFSVGKDMAIAKDKADKISNYVVSPIILVVLLELFCHGTKGDTMDEVKNIFKYPEGISWDTVHENLRLILQSYKSVEDGFKLSVKTRLFVDKVIPVLYSFEAYTKTNLFTETEKVDFKSSPDAGKDKINAWANESTNGKIDEICSKPLSKDTKLVAAGTLSLNGEFECPFDPALTADLGTFFTGKENITIPMMNGIMDIPYHKDEELGYEIISIPYKGNRFVLLIVKPTAIGNEDSKKKLYTNLGTKGFQPVLDKMKNYTVQISIPKMKIDIADNENITENLKSIGLKKIFNEGADFNALSTKKGIVVSKILQKFFIELSEAGSVGVKAKPKEIKQPPQVIFAFDSPSFLVLRDLKYGLDLFGARVTNPQPLK